jgi:NurA-like 5'-3' nuclease
LESLKEKIVELKKLKNFYSKEATTSNIRLFKLQNISWEEAIKALMENSEAIKNSQQLVKYDRLAYLEGIKYNINFSN